MADEQLTKQLTALEAQGKARFGEEGWQTTLDALARATGGAGIPEANMKEILKTNDAAGLLHTAAREQLLNESDGGNKDSEYAYAQIRQRERENHRRLKGRS